MRGEWRTANPGAVSEPRLATVGCGAAFQSRCREPREGFSPRNLPHPSSVTHTGREHSSVARSAWRNGRCGLGWGWNRRLHVPCRVLAAISRPTIPTDQPIAMLPNFAIYYTACNYRRPNSRTNRLRASSCSTRFAANGRRGGGGDSWGPLLSLQNCCLDVTAAPRASTPNGRASASRNSNVLCTHC